MKEYWTARHGSFKMKRVKNALAIWFALIMLLAPVMGHAFKRASVDDKDEIFLYWPVRDLTYSINARGSDNVPIGDVIAAVKRSARHWDSLGCTDLNVTFDDTIDHTVTNLTLAAAEQPDGINTVIWRESAWPPEESEQDLDRNIVALTTLVFDSRTGQIIDADIDVNGFHYTWIVTDDTIGSTFTDIENVLTHEFGHFFGLGHTDVPEATMWAITPPGELQKRTLHADDEEGICTIYPLGRATPLGLQQLPNLELRGGCGVDNNPASSVWHLLLLVILAIGRWAGGHRRGTIAKTGRT